MCLHSVCQELARGSINALLSEASGAEAVQLFVDRAQSALPSFRLTLANAATVVRICRRLDGIPLALELAAARVKLLTVEQIAARLDDRFRLLSGGSRTALPRHQTLSGLIAWSYDLLSEPERDLFRRLSVFAGGFSLEAVEAVCAGPQSTVADPLTLLGQLVDKSLVFVETADPSSPSGLPVLGARYRLLETVRQYAWERLSEIEAPRRGDAVAAVRDRHLAYYVKLAEAADPALRGGDQLAWLERLEFEHDNLRAALAWGLAPPDRGGGPARALMGIRLAAGLGWFWYVHSHLSEGRQWLDQALTIAGDGMSVARARVAQYAAILTHGQGNYGDSLKLVEASITMARAARDVWVEIWGLGCLAVILRYRGELARALAPAEAAVALATHATFPWEYAWASVQLAAVRLALGDTARAGALAEAGLTVFRELGDRWGTSNALITLGRTLLQTGDVERAVAVGTECVAVGRELGDRRGVANGLAGLALALTVHGNLAGAGAAYRESLQLAHAIGDKWGIVNGLHGIGVICHRRGASAAAARLYGAEAAVWHSMSGTVSVADPTRHARDLADTRAQLGEVAFTEAWAAGQAMTLDEAVATAIAAALEPEAHAEGTPA